MNESRKRRDSSVEHRSTKRRKRNSIHPLYSTRTITWKEQQTLPARFRLEPNVWPASKILQERDIGRKKEYLLEWEAHPTTGEVFQPTWEPAENVGQVLKQEWKRSSATEKPPAGPQDPLLETHNHVLNQATTRRVNARRIIPDSSAESEDPVVDYSASSRTPALTESPGSVDSGSLSVEISETQQPQRTLRNQTTVKVDVPPAPSDKSDWELLRESQFGHYQSPSIVTSLSTSNIQLIDSSSVPQNLSSPIDNHNTPISLLSLSTGPRSSLRSTASPFLDRGRAVRKILDYSSAAGTQHSQPEMAARNTRQSPRLQTSTPNPDSTSPRIAVRTNSFRARSSLNPPEQSSPLALNAEVAEPDQELMPSVIPNSSLVSNLTPEQYSPSMSTIPPAGIAPSAMHLDPPDTSIQGSVSQGSVGSDIGLNTLPTPIRDSIEEEASSAEEASLASKASSSQESLRNERYVQQVDGLVMPTYPILGEDEYAIALPAEGKVQAIYAQTVKVKRKAILKFIRRRGSVNHAGTSANKTIERNEMIELIGRLNDTTTHIDLGLPGIPTQYTIPSQEHATYAEYAGSKFVFLGQLMDYFKRRPATIVIMARSGATQDLLEEYLYIKNVHVRRHKGAHNSQQPIESPLANPTVELISTRASDVVHVKGRPSLIIAFDASFDSQDPQVRTIRAQSTTPIPIIHLLVTNSSEHVERCLPPSMPSPIRLRLLVRATYQAHLNLGGSPTIVTNPSDEMEGRPMDLGDISRAVRKSPNRKLQMVAAVVANAILSDDFTSNWTLSTMPELALDELDESPSTGSTISATPQRSRNRSQTPVLRSAGGTRNRSRTPLSRATTPSARKRQLEIDTTGLIHKRQRMTPVTEQFNAQDGDASVMREQDFHRAIELLRVELANEKRARLVAEEAKEAAENKATEWRTAHAMLQHRYEKRSVKSRAQEKANKSLAQAIDNSKQRVEKINADNNNLRQQVLQQKKDLEAARTELKSTGGDMAVLELAREEARLATSKAVLLEKSLANTKRDFEFLRNQYQDASSRAAELASQVSDLEKKVTVLFSKASDEKRLLKQMNFAESTKQHLGRISQLEAEKRSIQVMYKKLEDESKSLKRNRGVQTRGSSTAPGSPGQRSRQVSPAVALGPPSGSRASALRHER